MEVYQTPLDIQNRALQYVGARRDAGDATSLGAAEATFAYDKMRQAELRSNVWRFATRRVMLYPINTPTTGLTAMTSAAATAPTMQLVPDVWSATKVYGFGSVVDDGTGILWVSTEAVNLNQQPGGTGVTTWDSYFGPLTVMPYDSTVAYFTGDLVYEDNGRGGINVYVSLEDSNATDPQAVVAWSATTLYSKGQVVADAQGWFWQSTVDLNTNNLPGVYGLWDSADTYEVGEYSIGSDGKLYTALQTTTGNDPTTSSAYWQLSASTVGSWPMYNSNTTYANGDVVACTDGMTYQSLAAANKGNNPLTQPVYNPNSLTNLWLPRGIANPWTSAFIGSAASTPWLRLEATVKSLNINYPIGAGPASQMATRNVFMLPAGFLRIAPQDPKAGAVNYLGAPGYLGYKDWEFEGNFIVSHTPYPIMVRFVADVTLVTKFDPMFAEALAARTGLAICERVTQGQGKFNEISTAYKKFVDDAKTTNGIEIGPVEPSLDDFIACRI